MVSGQAVTISAIPEHLYRYTVACAPAGMSLAAWVNFNLQGLISAYGQLCGESGIPAGLDRIVSQVAAEASAARATDARVAEVGRAIEEAGTAGGQRPTLASTVASEALVTAEMQKLRDQGDHAEYEEGVRAARDMGDAGQLTKADLGNAIAQLARKAGNPYYAAGFFNSLNPQTLTELINLTGILGPGQDRSRVYQDLVTAMADGRLSRGSVSELANLFGSTGTQAGKQQLIGEKGSGIYVLGETVPVGEFYAERYQLLEDIAKNPEASANFIASMNPAQVQAILKSFDPNSAPYCRSSAGIKSLLQIMTNGVNSEPSPQYETETPPASTLVSSLSGDLEVLSAETLSQNNKELAAFMKASVSKLMPPLPLPLAERQLTQWSVQLRGNLGALAPLLESVGTAYHNTHQSISLQQEILANAMLGALTPLIPVPGGAQIAMGAGEGVAESAPALQNLVSHGMNYLIPDNIENSGQAALSASDQLDEVVMISGLVRVYESAGDSAGLQSLLKSPSLWGLVSAIATGGKKWSAPEVQLYVGNVPLSGDPNYTLGALLGLLNIASPKLQKQDLPS